MSLARLIPGFGAAVAAEARVRSAPFVDTPPRVLCGVEVRPFTLRDHERLSYVRSPFLCGGEPDRADVARLLYYQHIPPGCPGALPLCEADFAAQFDALDLAEMAAEIGAYLDEFLMDAPKGGGSGAPAIGLATSMVHRLRSAYSDVSRDDVLDMDLRELFGYVRCIQRDMDPQAVLFNTLSDPAKSRFARELMERQAEAAVAQRESDVSRECEAR